MEEEFKVKVVSSGRVTIPSYVRRKLGIEKGDVVVVKIRKGSP